MTERIIHGDCLDVMRAMDADSIDAIVTDPPYGIGFMGKQWDRFDADAVEASWSTRGRKNEATRDQDASTPHGRSTTGVSFRKPNPRCGICGRAINGRDTAKGFKVCHCPEPQPVPSANRDAHRFQEFMTEWAAECWRVAKPGSYLLAFGGTRTYHRMTCAIEDAGWEIHDCLTWLYGSGFPKHKSKLKPAWEPIVMARKPAPKATTLNIDATRVRACACSTVGDSSDGTSSSRAVSHAIRTLCTALAALSEPSRGGPVSPLASVIARALRASEPLGSPVDYPSCRRCGDALSHLVATVYREVSLRPRDVRESLSRALTALCSRGSLCVDHPSIADDLARIAEYLAYAEYTQHNVPDQCACDSTVRNNTASIGYGGSDRPFTSGSTLGRWPANVCCDEIAAAEIDAQSGELTSGANPTRRGSDKFRSVYDTFAGQRECTPARGVDSGGASRFFYCAKASRSEREAGLEGFATRTLAMSTVARSAEARGETRNVKGDIGLNDVRHVRNNHPTVKPVALMRWLVRLVTPPGGTVLDPFAGSGTTGIAAVLEDRSFIGIDNDDEYVPITDARVAHHAAQGSLFRPVE